MSDFSEINIDETLFKEEIKVFAPATVANMISGFDILGFALNEPGDEVIMRRSDQPGVRILKITGDDGRLPIDTDKNTVSACVKMLLNDLGLANKIGLEIELHKKMPIGSGLGSSAASTVAGLFAANEILGKPLTKKQLFPYTIEGERLACGTGHADNVGPALFGGITLIKQGEVPDIISLPVPKELCASVIFPQVEVPTRDARKLIKNQINLSDAVGQWGNIAALVAGIYREDYELIGYGMNDLIFEPVRSILIPYFQNMKELALKEGALSFGISGSGPSVVAICNDRNVADKISHSLQEFLNSKGIGHFAYVSSVNKEGPRVL